MLDNTLIVGHFSYSLSRTLYLLATNNNDIKYIRIMLVSLLFQLKVFLFVLASFVVVLGALRAAYVFRFKNGKLVNSDKELTLFGVSISYIITMLVCGF